MVTRWAEFLDLYVANEVPELPAAVRSLSDALYQSIAGAPAAPVEQTRFAGTSDVAAARAAFERDPRVRLLMDNGAGPAGPGALGHPWELQFDAWPLRELAPTTYYLGPGGMLDRPPPAGAGEVSYTSDAAARPAQALPGSGADDAWEGAATVRLAAGRDGEGARVRHRPARGRRRHRGAVEPRRLPEVLGARHRPPGDDQRGAARRPRDVRAERLAARVAPPARPPSHDRPAPRAEALARHAAPVPRGRYTIVRIPLLPAAHAFRAGSRIRVTVQAPGGDRPRWRFASVDRGRTRNAVGIGGSYASRLVLPVVAGAAALGTPLPAPTALRGQPSRAHRPASNGG